ncbi:MAG: division/cell wall cluster transcriptional repressor MraZ [Treponema sp.]|nr:division/cell wall cluster transcriptional repressor MraZ [Spirochaetia bacterium]MDY2839549.1 division/cell wall cluster transcriptional repressor MraZ [Treponema sp.]MDY5123588.1 division/cell wall cluster transcriptional repressor MraZ [Treponema sp.]
MNLLTGEYNNTIDEKGRVSFPVKLRTSINQNVLIVTKGSERCLWLFTSSEWESFQSKLMSNASMMNAKNMQVVRHFIAPAQEVEFDKSGRLSIPQSLREYANLSKECTILGIAKYVELWDSQVYKNYIVESEESFREAAEGFNNITF